MDPSTGTELPSEDVQAVTEKPMNSYTSLIATSCIKSSRWSLGTFWLNETISDASNAALSFQTSVVLQNPKFHSPLSPFKICLADSSLTWCHYCVISSPDFETCRKRKERFPRVVRSRSLSLRFGLLDSSKRHWCSFARNFLLSSIASTLTAWFSAERNDSHQTLLLSPCRQNVFKTSAFEKTTACRTFQC